MKEKKANSTKEFQAKSHLKSEKFQSYLKSEKFQDDLSSLLNSHGIDSELDTPDFVIAEMVAKFLTNFRRN